MDGLPVRSAKVPGLLNCAAAGLKYIPDGMFKLSLGRLLCTLSAAAAAAAAAAAPGLLRMSLMPCGVAAAAAAAAEADEEEDVEEDDEEEEPGQVVDAVVVEVACIGG